MTVRSCLKSTLVGLTQFLNYYAVIYDVDDIKKKRIMRMATMNI
jgi:hypothetical protein